MVNIESILGPNIGNVFSAMETTEEVLAQRGLSHAERGGVSLFMRCAPTPVLEKAKAREVMVMHVNELCDRYERGEPFELATNAEIICALHGASLRAPLNAEAMAVLKHITTGTFLEACYHDVVLRERWAGHVQETLSTLRRQLRAEARR